MKVAIEVDGLAYHNGQDSFIKDQRRQRWLQSQGWLVIRFAAKEVTANPHRCLREVDDLAAGRGPSGHLTDAQKKMLALLGELGVK